MYGTISILSYSKRVKSREKKLICTCHVSINRSLKHIVSKLETPGYVIHELLFLIVTWEHNMEYSRNIIGTNKASIPCNC